MDLTDILIALKKQNEKYFREPVKYCGMIKQRAVDLFGENINVFLFGSLVKGGFTYLSDIDVLVMVPGLIPGLHADKIVYLKNDFEISSPFSVILVNEKQFEDWFKPFILDKYIVI